MPPLCRRKAQLACTPTYCPKPPRGGFQCMPLWLARSVDVFRWMSCTASRAEAFSEEEHDCRSISTTALVLEVIVWCMREINYHPPAWSGQREQCTEVLGPPDRRCGADFMDGFVDLPGGYISLNGNAQQVESQCCGPTATKLVR